MSAYKQRKINLQSWVYQRFEISCILQLSIINYLSFQKERIKSEYLLNTQDKPNSSHSCVITYNFFWIPHCSLICILHIDIANMLISRNSFRIFRLLDISQHTGKFSFMYRQVPLVTRTASWPDFMFSDSVNELCSLHAITNTQSMENGIMSKIGCLRIEQKEEVSLCH